MIDVSRPWHELKIDTTDALLPGLSLDKMHQESLHASNPINVFFIENTDTIFNKSWIQYLESLGLFISACVLFYRDPQYQQPDAHVDLLHTGGICYYGCNFTTDPDDDAQMVWFDVLPESGIYEETINAGTPYLHWPIEQIQHQEIARKRIGTQLTLINTSIPHNIIMGDRPRWGISVRFFNPAESWEQAVEIFKNYIK